MEKWIVSQEVYDEFQELKHDDEINTVLKALEKASKALDILREPMFPYLYMLLDDNSKSQVLFAKAWAEEIKIEVEKPERYLLFQVDKNSGHKCYVVKYPSGLIDYNFDKNYATRFTADEYPHYKNDFMQVEEIN